MANTILHKRSSTASSVPTGGQLTLGELALNTTDGKVFMKNGAGSVVEVSYRDARVESFLGGGTLASDIIPATDNTYSLGSSSKMWKDIYVGPGSLYVNGQKVLEESSGNIIVSADVNQNLVIQTSGSGDIELDPTGSGTVTIKGTLVIEAGSNVTSSDGNAIAFGNQIKIDSITSKTTNTDLTLTANGSGKVYINDAAEVSGNLVIGGNLTVSGTTTTVNSETISLADNIIDLNSNFTSGSPTENAGIRVMRGDEAAVQIRWNESSDVWEFTNDGSTYIPMTGTSATQTLTNKTINLTSNTLTGTVAQFNTALSDGDFATLAGTETLTNKTIAAGSNTISGLTNTNLSGSAGITNANLANSSVTIGSTSVSLGATATTIAGLTSVTSTGFTGALTGNATTASAWANSRTITLAGDLSGSVSIDGSANATLTATIAANSVALGTDTTGNYMSDVTAGTGITVTHTPGEGSSAAVAIDSTVATLTGSQTLTNKTIALGSNTVSGTVAQFNTALTDGDFATLAGSETLTNKTLTAPNISALVITDGSITVEGATADAFETTLAFTDPTADRTITFPDLTGTVVTTGDTGTVTNTMLAGSIANNKLSNSTISGKALGTNLDSLTISTGLSGTSYNGSSAVTIAIDSTVATLTGSQTLTNKTLTAPTINTPTITGMILGDASIIFEGATADAFETTLTVTDPTADRTITLPDATTTLVGTDTAQSLTNKTLGATTIAGHLIPDTDVIYDLGSETYRFRDLYLSGASIKLGSATITSSGATIVLPANSTIAGTSGTATTTSSTDTLSNKTISLGSNTITGTKAQFNAALTDGDFATLAGTETLTNKTLTSPTVSGLTLSDASIVFEGATADAFETTLTVTDPTADRTITLPDVTGTVVTTGDTGSVTNTMLAGSIANAKLTNSSITVNGNSVSLGGSTTVTANTTNALTIGTGLSGTSFNGSGAVTIAIDSTVATLTGTQTLTNKTIAAASNTISGLTNSNLSGSAGITNANLENSSITINGSSVSLGGTRTLVTDDIAEDGSPVNLWYTDARARAAVSVTDSGGDGSLSYNSGTGVITYTGPSATEVRAHLSAGTGVTYSGGQISIGQAVGTSDNVTFNNVTVSGTLTSDDITSASISISGNATITGNLTVQGTTTTVNSNTVSIGDSLITLNSDETGAPSQDGGIEIERGTSTNVSLVWDETNDRWTVGSETFVAGTFLGNLTGNVTGNVTGTVSGNAGTVTNGVYTTDTGTVTNTMLAGSIADTKLSTISTAGKVSNSATTATNANTASAIVARDASGNFSAGTITAALSGNASTATTLQNARTINGVSFDGSGNITVTAAAGTLSGATLASGVTASSLTSVGTLTGLTVSGAVSFTDATASTTKTTGALVVTGGLGVGGAINAGGEVTAYASSDERMKENISVISNAMGKINAVRGVTFDWKDEIIEAKGGEDGYFVRKHDVGVIAQEIETILPEIVATRDNGTKAVRYEKLVALLIEAVKELGSKVEQLEAKAAK